MNPVEIYNLLKEIVFDIEQPEENESADQYISRTLSHRPELSKYILTSKEVENIIPLQADQEKKEAWEGRAEGLEKLLAKVSSDEVKIIQGIDGSFHGRIKLTETQKLLYEKTIDYSFSIAFSEILDKHLSKIDQNDREELIKIVCDNLDLLNQDGGLFVEAVLNEIHSSKQFAGKLNLLILDVVEEFSTLGYDKVSEIDNLISRGVDASTPGISVNISAGNQNQPGILITTSNGGGCHKNIANVTIQKAKVHDINCALINESELDNLDSLHSFIGIPKANVYPIVFQKCGNMECRELLSEIDETITQKFMPKTRFARLRQAIKFCEDKMPVSVLYSTQHYAHDLRVAPSGSKVLFQLCDYATMAKLADLGTKVGKLSISDSVKFLIPSKTCIADKGEVPENFDPKSKYYQEQIPPNSNPAHFVRTIYPTLILPQKESEEKFKSFVEQNALYPTDEAVVRCAIVMGGQGCGALIEDYLDRVLNDVNSIQDSEKKMEFIVVCGNNKTLKDDLERKYKDKFPENVKVKFCGFVKNDELIAYCKNSVLITKPGGGTISECIQNDIQALVHVDPKHWWEKGNADQICLKGGKAVNKNQPILPQIEESMQKRNNRSREKEENIREFQGEVQKISRSVENLIEEQHKLNIPQNRRLIHDLRKIQVLLEGMLNESPYDRETAIKLRELTKYIKNDNLNQLRKNPDLNFEKFIQKYKGKLAHEILMKEMVADKGKKSK